jgi:hypothetical protein
MLLLTDGGVFDNLADAWHMEHSERRGRVQEEMEHYDLIEEDIWLHGMAKRFGLYDEVEAMQKFSGDYDELKAKHTAAREVVLSRLGRNPDCLILVNGGTVLPWRRIAYMSAPLIGELLGFLKISAVMYNNTVSERVRDPRARSSAANPEGVVIDMNDHPRTPTFPADAERKERWWSLHDRLGSKIVLYEIHTDSRRVRTTLLPLGEQTTARLLYHGYLQAMTSLFVEFGCPFPESVPTLEPFQRLVAGAGRESSKTVEQSS